MVFEIPGVGQETERKPITTDMLRGIILEFASFDFRAIVEGTVGNFFGISRGLFLISIFTGLLFALAHLIPNFLIFTFTWLVGTLPIWLPAAVVVAAWKSWITYVRSYFIANQQPVLLEAKMPRNLEKSPRGMDVALSHLWHDASVTTFYNRVWYGGVRPIFSLEIASFGGEIHFYIWTWKAWLNAVETMIYSQYPEVELEEVEDYASKFSYDPKKHAVFATDHRYEPRSDAYPLKTYVEDELDADPKEEHKVDSLAVVVESLNNIKPEEQLWLQIVITSHMEHRHKAGTLFQFESQYEALVHEEVNKIRKELVVTHGPDEEWKRYSRIPLHRVTEQIKAIERNAGKYPFNVGVRGVYISTPELFGQTFNTLRRIWRPMGNPEALNHLRPRRWHVPFDYPYQDLWDIRWNIHTRRFFDCYRRRAHFYTPYPLPYNVMSTEVIATLWHPISTGVQTPGVERIPARKAEAPPNLPK